MDNSIALLRNISFLRSLPDEILLSILSRLQRKHYERGERVFARGEIGDAIYIVESGQAALVIPSPTGGRILRRIDAGHAFGEFALLTGTQQATSGRVTRDTNLLVLLKSDLDELVTQYPLLAQAVSHELLNSMMLRIPLDRFSPPSWPAPSV